MSGQRLICFEFSTLAEREIFPWLGRVHDARVVPGGFLKRHLNLRQDGLSRDQLLLFCQLEFV